MLVLPDKYPGPSCTNAQPDSAERSRVEQLWANGLAEAVAEVRS